MAHPAWIHILSITCRLTLGALSGCFLGAALSCATTSDTIGMEELDGNNQAPGAAYVVDAMHIRRPMPGHKDWKPLQFYYKHCTDLGDEIYYSKTNYGCSDPF